MYDITLMCAGVTHTASQYLKRTSELDNDLLKGSYKSPYPQIKVTNWDAQKIVSTGVASETLFSSDASCIRGKTIRQEVGETKVGI